MLFVLLSLIIFRASRLNLLDIGKRGIQVSIKIVYYIVLKMY